MFSLFGKKILVVEDSGPLVKAIEVQLGRGGYRVLKARSYDEAVEHLESNKKIRAVWLDHYLIGEKSGLDVLRYMREQARFKNTPIFVISAIDQEVRKYYEKLNVTRLYIKSEYQLGVIISEIKNILKGGIDNVSSDALEEETTQII